MTEHTKLERVYVEASGESLVMKRALWQATEYLYEQIRDRDHVCSIAIEHNITDRHIITLSAELIRNKE